MPLLGRNAIKWKHARELVFSPRTTSGNTRRPKSPNARETTIRFKGGNRRIRLISPLQAPASAVKNSEEEGQQSFRTAPLHELSVIHTWSRFKEYGLDIFVFNEDIGRLLFPSTGRCLISLNKYYRMSTR
jgi:hypothetical protein